GWACRWGRLEVVKLLLERGADPVEADAEPWATPRAWAEKMGHDAVLTLLPGVAPNAAKSNPSSLRQRSRKNKRQKEERSRSCRERRPETMKTRRVKYRRLSKRAESSSSSCLVVTERLINRAIRRLDNLRYAFGGVVHFASDALKQ